MLFLFTLESGYQVDRTLQYPESVHQHNKTKKIKHFKPLTNLTPSNTDSFHLFPALWPHTSSFSYSLRKPSSPGSYLSLFLASLGFSQTYFCFESFSCSVSQLSAHPGAEEMQLQSQDYNCLGLYFQEVLD